MLSLDVLCIISKKKNKIVKKSNTKKKVLLQWSDKTPHIKMYLMKMFNIFFLFYCKNHLLIKGKKASEKKLPF